MSRVERERTRRSTSSASRKLLTQRCALLVFVVLISSCGAEPGRSGSTESDAATLHWPPYVIDQPQKLERAAKLTWRYDPKDAPEDLAPGKVLGAIRQAFGEWAAQSPGIEVAEQAPSEAAAFLSLSWHGQHGNQCSFPHWDGGLAHVLVASSADDARALHMNSEASELRALSSFTSMLRHEFGHVLGLGHTDPSRRGVMAPAASLVGDSIDPAASAGIATLYGAPAGRKVGAQDLIIRKQGTNTERHGVWFGLGHQKLRARLLDTDGDHHPEALLWLDRELGPLFIVHFDAKGRIRKTAGPFVGFTLPTRTTHVGRHKSGALIAVHTDSLGRQVASRLRTESDGRPGDPWLNHQGLEIDQDYTKTPEGGSPSVSHSAAVLAAEQGWVLERGG